MTFSYGTLCSGIEGAAVAFGGLPWRHAYCAEVEPFCRDLLAARYPDAPNFGDITTATGFPNVNLLVAGTPCQSFSQAGKRRGLDDLRGQLALRFVEILDETRPRWILWENVPGVLSSGEGRDFAAFLEALAQVGYGFAWRVLDSRFFGVAQRRRRVFVVGYLRAWRPAANVLFGEAARRGDATAPRTAQRGTPNSSGRAAGVVGFTRTSDVTHAVDPTPTLSGQGKDRCYGVIGFTGDPTPKHADDATPTLRAQQGGEGVGVVAPNLFRRLTVTEWERLQGFPDGYTALPGASDSKRRKALGNSFAVPVVRWIGERIAAENTELSFLD